MELLNKAVRGLKGEELDRAIQNTRAYIQKRGYQRETMYHKALYALVARKLELELKGGKNANKRKTSKS